MALVVDDILFFPYRGIKWIFKEITKIAEEELEGEPERITAQLSELYMLLETEKISEEEFAEQEKVLLDRLDELEGTDGEDGYELDDAEGGEESSTEDVEEEEEEGDWDEWDDWGNWDEEDDENEGDESPDSGESS